MKVMLFIDHQNYCQSLWGINSYRQEKISGFSNFLIDYLNKKLVWEKYNPRLIRSYVYTGQYTDSLIKKIKSDLETIKTKKPHLKDKIEKILEDSERRQKGQKRFFKIARSFDFFELRTKPLQYSRGRVFQKGVDVQLAVDLVAHAYQDSYDVAVVCSGDVDLIESIKLVKNLGKKVIIVSHPKNTASHMFREADHYINMAEIEEEALDKISHKTKSH